MTLPTPTSALGGPRGTPTTEPSTGNGHARNLGGEVKALVAPDLLPTPTSAHNGNTPERHLAKKPGRERVTSLQVMVEHDLIATGGRLLPTPTSVDSKDTRGRRLDGTPYSATSGVTLTDAVTSQDWGPYEQAIARHALLMDREPPPPTNARGQLSARFVEWMMCHPSGWVTDLCTRSQSLRSLGNGVVPPQAATAITWLLGRAIR